MKIVGGVNELTLNQPGNSPISADDGEDRRCSSWHVVERRKDGEKCPNSTIMKAVSHVTTKNRRWFSFHM
jgi:hypothetical protein